jgi:hypothetical protein
MAWELINCEAQNCTMDDSKHYVVVNYVGSGQVRCDIMRTAEGQDDAPVKSYMGYFKDVRKYVVRFLEYAHISYEHASYIGEELALADSLKELYIQD